MHVRMLTLGCAVAGWILVLSLSGGPGAVSLALGSEEPRPRPAVAVPPEQQHHHFDGAVDYHGTVDYSSETGEADKVGAAVVFGEDGRWRITPTTDSPASTIAYLAVLDSEGNEYGNCTGTFIGPDVLVTAAHCLVDPATGQWIDGMAVYPGKDGALNPYGYELAADAWVSPGWASGDDSEWWDWGFVKLPDADLGHAAGWLKLGALSDEDLSSPQLEPVIAGYPGDKPYGTQWAAKESAFSSVEQFTLGYQIDTYAGQSGSAIRRASDNLIVGIHRGESPDSLNNVGVRVDQEVVADGEAACARMGCTIGAYKTYVPFVTSR